MMDQRMFLAVGLSMLVILGFYLLVPVPHPPPTPPKPVETVAGANGNDQAAPVASSPPVSPAAPAPSSIPARTIRVETPHYIATVDTRGARLTSLLLKDYKLGKESLDWGDLLPPLRRWISKPAVDPKAAVQMVKQLPGGHLPLEVIFAGDSALTQAFNAVVYTSPQQDTVVSDGKSPVSLTLTGDGPGGLQVRKVLTFRPDSYAVDYELQVINYGDTSRPLHIISAFGLGPDTHHARSSGGHFGPMYRADGKIHKEDPDDIPQALRVNQPQWLALNDTYFIAAAAPQTPPAAGLYTLVPGAKEDKYPVVGFGLELPDVSLEPQKMITSRFKLYFGPKSTDAMLKFGGKLEESLDLTLDFIASPMLAMLRWFYSFTHNYGVAIILLTVVVRVVLFPLTYKGMVTMKRMSKLQPKMMALRERFKDDKERMNREMMEMYRKYRINPLSGCLPILLQIPIFFALYSALLGAIELRHSPFIFWITDLSARDGLYVLPLFMGVSMFVQQKLTPTSLDPVQAKIMLWMPVVFTFFMLSFPAGLTLYWSTSNVLSIAQQLIINRVQVPDFAD